MTIVSSQAAPEAGITVSVPTAHYDSNLLNYADYYEEWDEGEGEECRTCRGTGMDKWEEFECEDCGGEGKISSASFLTRRG